METEVRVTSTYQQLLLIFLLHSYREGNVMVLPWKAVLLGGEMCPVAPWIVMSPRIYLVYTGIYYGRWLSYECIDIDYLPRSFF